MEEDDIRTIPLLAGWYFGESSRLNGISHYVLMSPTGLSGSDEIHEDELKGLIKAQSGILSAPFFETIPPSPVQRRGRIRNDTMSEGRPRPEPWYEKMKKISSPC